MTDSPSKDSGTEMLPLQPASDELSLDTLFDALTNSRRRYALLCLSEYQTPLALADLADEVAEREYESPVAEIPGEVVKEVYVSLYHAHIPKLEEAALVQYNQERDAVTVSEEFEAVEQLLDDISVNT